MAIVTRQFKNDFETWAAARIACGAWTPAEMEEFRDMLRRDLAPGPDQFRAGLTVIIAAGVEVSASIGDHEERYRLWAEYFATEVESIQATSQREAQ